MTIPIPEGMQSARVTWPQVYTAGDEYSPSGLLGPARGKIRFEPTARAVNYPGGTILPMPVETPVTNGQMRAVKLTVNDPAVWNWRVIPMLGVDWEPFHVDILGTTNMSTVAVAPGTGEVRALPGKQGPQGKSITDVQQPTVETLRMDLEDPATGAADRRYFTLPAGPEGPYGGTEVTDPQVASYVDTETQTRKALDRSYQQGVSVLRWGAVGDGATDDTAAIQAALDNAFGLDVFAPAGTYLVSSTLTGATGATLRGEAGTVLRSSTDTIIDVSGSVGERVSLGVNATKGDRAITTATPHGLERGDIVQFQSQRVSTSADAGAWRLGYATGSGQGPFFGEFATVYSVESDTTFTLSSGLIFPDYRIDRTLEADAAAGATATVAKVNAVRDVVISNLTIEGPSDVAIHMTWAVDCLIDSVRYVKPDPAGKFIELQQCYRTEGRDCWINNTADPATVGTIYSANSYHILASQACGFDGCTAIGGTQCFDITYSQAALQTSNHCYVKNSKSVGASGHAMTVHPGVYAPRVEGCDFTECGSNGLTIRGNRAIVRGNVLRGSGAAAGGYGIAITEGAGREAMISGNTIEGFQWGTAMIDGASKPFAGYIGVTISGNTITDCAIGYRRYRNVTTVQTQPEGIIFTGNMVSSSVPGAVGVETSDAARPVWGMLIDGNTFNLPTDSSAAALKIRPGVRDILFTNNVVAQAGNMVILSSSGSSAWPAYGVVDVTGTRVIGARRRLPANTPEVHFSSSDPEPIIVGGPDLSLYTDTITLRVATVSQVTTAKGFPVDTVDGDLQVVGRSDTSVVQRYQTMTGELWSHNTNSAGAFNAWGKRY